MSERITEEEIGEIANRLRLDAILLVRSSQELVGDAPHWMKDVAANCDRARDALALRSGDGRPASRGKEGWQPIETAPTDLGRYQFISRKGVQCVDGYVIGGGCSGHRWQEVPADPYTHWRKCPAPPGSPTEAGPSPHLTGWNEAREAAAISVEEFSWTVPPNEWKVREKLSRAAERIRALEPSTGKELGKEGSS